MDAIATLHIKHMGEGTFTEKVHKLASAHNHDSIVMNVQGPYGPCVDLHSNPNATRVLLVAGGIGVTPMLSALRCAVQRANIGKLGKLKRLRLVWSARSPAVFDILKDEVALCAVSGALEVELSLYCSSYQGTNACAVGTVHSGIPNFLDILAEETAQGERCMVRVCGPPPMVLACAAASKEYVGLVDFEPWSFVL